MDAKVTYGWRPSPFGPASLNSRTNARGKATSSATKRFVDAHLVDARKAADQLDVPVENILGVSAVESDWGEARFAVEGNNYEAHHFKYALFRRPGDVHVHFFGAATLSGEEGFFPQSLLAAAGSTLALDKTTALQ